MAKLETTTTVQKTVTLDRSTVERLVLEEARRESGFLAHQPDSITWDVLPEGCLISVQVVFTTQTTE